MWVPHRLWRSCGPRPWPRSWAAAPPSSAAPCQPPPCWSTPPPGIQSESASCKFREILVKCSAANCNCMAFHLCVFCTMIFCCFIPSFHALEVQQFFTSSIFHFTTSRSAKCWHYFSPRFPMPPPALVKNLASAASSSVSCCTSPSSPRTRQLQTCKWYLTWFKKRVCVWRM